MFSYGSTPFPLDLQAGRAKPVPPAPPGQSGSGEGTQSDSKEGKASKEFRNPYSKKFSQRINQIHAKRIEEQEQSSQDLLAQRGRSGSFQVLHADHSKLHHSRRSFGAVEPTRSSRSRSPSYRVGVGEDSSSRGRSRSHSADSIRSEVSRSRSRSNSRGEFKRELQLARDLQAEEKLREEELQAKREYYANLLRAKPWVPSGVKQYDQQSLNTISNPNLGSVLIQQKAQRRSPWAGAIPDDRRPPPPQTSSTTTTPLGRDAESSSIYNRSWKVASANMKGREIITESPPGGVPQLSARSSSPPPLMTAAAPPSERLQIDPNASLRTTFSFSRDNATTPRSVSVSSIRSAPEASQSSKRAGQRKPSSRIALTVRIINTKKTSNQSKYGILVVKRGGTRSELVGDIEKQFHVFGQVSDISIASQPSYGSGVSIASLSLGTIGEYPQINENSDLIIYLGGALYQEGQGHGGHLFSQPLRDFRNRQLQPQPSQASPHGLLDKEDMMFYDSMVNNVQAFDEYTKSQFGQRIENGDGARFRDFDRQKHAYSPSASRLGAPKSLETLASSAYPSSPMRGDELAVADFTSYFSAPPSEQQLQKQQSDLPGNYDPYEYTPELMMENIDGPGTPKELEDPEEAISPFSPPRPSSGTNATVSRGPPTASPIDSPVGIESDRERKHHKPQLNFAFLLKERSPSQPEVLETVSPAEPTPRRGGYSVPADTRSPYQPDRLEPLNAAEPSPRRGAGIILGLSRRPSNQSTTTSISGMEETTVKKSPVDKEVKPKVPSSNTFSFSLHPPAQANKAEVSTLLTNLRSSAANPLRLEMPNLMNKAGESSNRPSGDLDDRLTKLENVYERLHRNLPKRYQPADSIDNGHHPASQPSTPTQRGRSRQGEGEDSLQQGRKSRPTSRSRSPVNKAASNHGEPYNKELTFQPKLFTYAAPKHDNGLMSPAMVRAEKAHLSRHEAMAFNYSNSGEEDEGHREEERRDGPVEADKRSLKEVKKPVADDQAWRGKVKLEERWTGSDTSSVTIPPPPPTGPLGNMSPSELEADHPVHETFLDLQSLLANM
eukprot:gene1924-2102_t